MQQINLPKTQGSVNSTQPTSPAQTPVQPEPVIQNSATVASQAVKRPDNNQGPMQPASPSRKPAFPGNNGVKPPRPSTFQQPGNNGWGNNDVNDSWDAGWNDPWSDPWGTQGGSNNFGGSNQSQPKKLTPQERVEMIEKLYQEVLNRKPDTRDINYYKYSTLSEDEIRKQLITGKEHTQLMSDGREFNKMRDRAEQAETRIKMLEQQIRDQVDEFKELTELLQEKNRYIQNLRQEKQNPYNLVSPQTFAATNANHYYSVPSSKPEPSRPEPQVQAPMPPAPAPRVETPTVPVNEPVRPPIVVEEPLKAETPPVNMQTTHMEPVNPEPIRVEPVKVEPKPVVQQSLAEIVLSQPTEIETPPVTPINEITSESHLDKGFSRSSNVGVIPSFSAPKALNDNNKSEQKKVSSLLDKIKSIISV